MTTLTNADIRRVIEGAGGKLDAEELLTWIESAPSDSFLSGQGDASGGTSVAAWACRPEDRERVLAWVRARGEMRRVREVSERERLYRPGRPCVHFHVYVVTRGHPALRGAEH